MAFSVRELIAGKGEPVCVRLTDEVSKALEIMVENDFSQLPVINEKSVPIGLITSDSVMTAIRSFGLKFTQLRVKDAYERPNTCDIGDDIFELLNRFHSTSAILVVDKKQELKGILTTWDTTDYFSKRAEDMMLVERIEKAMREHIEWAFTDEQTGEIDRNSLDAMIKTATGRQKSYDKLTYGEYLRILTNEVTWNRVSETFDLDRDGVITLLEQVRDIRNILAHFREEITRAQRKHLRKALQWLEGHSAKDQRVDDAQSTPDRPVVTTGFGTMSEVHPQVEAEFENSDSAYAKLAAYLFQLSVKTQSIKLSFEEIEGIIGRELPDSAYKHRAWWANDSVSHSWSKLWLDAEWRAQSINLTERHITFSRIVERQRLYIEFFSALVKAIQEKNKFTIPKDIRGGESYMRLIAYLHSATKCEVNFNFSFARNNRFRVELYLYAPDTTDKRLFDQLLGDKDSIEMELGMPLSWERLEDTRAARIAVYQDGSITDGDETLATLRQWAVDTMLVFEKVLHPRVKAVLDGLKQ